MWQSDKWHKTPFKTHSNLLFYIRTWDTPMYRTLSELRNSINQMIERQGEDAGCAAFVFTKEDVFEFNEVTDKEEYFSSLLSQDVLCDVGDSSYIYEEVGGMIDDSIRKRKHMEIYSGDVPVA